MKRTSIQWTTFSSNPLRYRTKHGTGVWACQKVSPGCVHCYSETLALRYGRGGPFNQHELSQVTPYLDEAELKKWISARQIDGCRVSGGKCFVGDMTDVFGDWVPDALLDRMFAYVALRSDVVFQVLTKRAERLFAYFDGPARDRIAGQLVSMGWHHAANRIAGDFTSERNWPLKNLWLGVSAENQEWADERIPWLVRVPATIRFVSYEPALGPVSLRRFDGVDWVIVGGESGPGARPFDLTWAHAVVAECQDTETAVFYKQSGASHRCSHDEKGGCQACMPPDLRVRQFPVTE